MIRKLFIGFLIYLIGGFPTLVFALPQGGEVVSGAVGIQTPNANDMSISQGTDQAIVNWQGFDIGQQESVTINQPNSNSVILNRVVGENPSAILGKLSANGRVFLTNPSGILFGPSARVNVGALVASTLNISNQDFLDRNYRFTQDENKPLASIINLGEINAGSVGLTVPRVENRGTIVANLGAVAIASGEKTALDFEGDGLINFEITEPVSGKIQDANGNVIQSGVINSGLIQANGGQVVLSALQAQGMIQSVVNNEGMIEAKGVEKRNGKVFLLGADEIINEGTIDVSGTGEGETGGSIHLLGKEVSVKAAILNASGDSGGGEILIGGDWRGQNKSILNATNTSVAASAKIHADATHTGDGGKVIVWSENSTKVYATISARGGANGGNGGFVETSGKKFLDVTKAADVSASNGKAGTWLLDPTNIEIVSGPGNGDGSQVSVTTIETALNAGTSVHIITSGQGLEEGTITVSTAIVKSSGGDTSLTLTAHGDIMVNQSITSTAGTLDVNLISGADIFVNAAIATNGGSVLADAGATNLSANISGSYMPAARISGAAVVLPKIEVNADITTGGGSVTLGQFKTKTHSLIGGGTYTKEKQAVTDVTVQTASIDTGGGDFTINGSAITVASTATVTSPGGNILIESTSKDIVGISGILNAANAASSQTGGTIHVLGYKVGIFDNAQLDTSGDAGGGTILIGGDYQGNNDEIQNAYRTYIGKDAVIKADATNTGNGGKVIVWADDTTRFYGDIFARGGSISGDGGFVETSGKNYLDARGFVNTLAANGNAGVWLLDPTDVVVANGGGATLVNVDQFADAGGTVTIDAATINAAASNVTIQANNNITINEAISISTAGITLTLQAGDDILVNQNVTTNNAAISFTANAAGASETNTGTNGVITMADGTTVDAGNATITFSAQGDITLGRLVTTNTGTTAISLTSTLGGIVDGGDTGGVDIETTSGRIVISAQTGIGISSSNSIEINGASLDATNVSSGGIDLIDTGGIILINLDSSAANGVITFSSTGAISINDGSVKAGSGNISITSTAGQLNDTNDGGTAESITTTGTITLTAFGSIGASGSEIEIGSSTNLTIDTNADIGVSSSTTLTDLAITLDPGAGTSAYSITDGNMTLSLTDNTADLILGGLTLAGGNLNFTMTVDTGALTTSGNIDVNSGNFSVTTTVGSQNYTNSIAANNVTLVVLGTGSDLAINNTITTATGGSVSLTAIDSITFSAAGDVTASGIGNVTVTANSDNVSDNNSDVITMTDGAVIDAGSGTITLESTGNTGSNITIGRLVTTNSTASAVVVNTDQAAIIDGGDTGGNDVEAVNGTITLTGITGIGSAGAIEINTAKLIVDSNQSIQVANAGTLTDLTITLDPNGGVNTYTITDGGNLTLTVTDDGPSLTLNALSLSSGNLNFTFTQDSGTFSTGSNLQVNSGNFTLNTTGGQNLAHTIGANNITLNADGTNSDVNINQTLITVSGGSVTITADDSVTFAAAGDIIASGAGNISITANTNTSDGDSFDRIIMTDGTLINAGSGTITLTSTGTNAGDIVIGGLLTTSTGNSAVTLTTAASVTDAGATDVDVVATSGRLVIDAATGITLSNITVDSLDVDNLTSGNITLTESDAISVFKLSNAATGGTISLTNTVAIITIESGGSGVTSANGDISIVAGTVGTTSDLLINAAVTSNTGAGQVQLQARDNVTFASGVTVTSGTGDLLLLADSDDDGAGLLTTPSGGITMNGGALKLTSGTGIGSAGSAVATTGVTNFSANTTTGGIYLSNTGGSAINITTVAALVGVTADAGDIQITNTGGNFTTTQAVTATGSTITINAATINVNAGGILSNGGVNITATGTLTVAAGVQIIAENDASGSGNLSINAAGIILNGGGAGMENLENEGSGNISITSSGNITFEDHVIGLLGGALSIDAGTNTITELTVAGNTQIRADGNISITAGGIGGSNTNEDIILDTSTSGSNTLNLTVKNGGQAFLTTSSGDDSFNQVNISIDSAATDFSMTFDGGDSVVFNSSNELSATLSTFDIGLNFALNDSTNDLNLTGVTGGGTRNIEISSNAKLIQSSGLITVGGSADLRLVGIKGVGTSPAPILTSGLKGFAGTSTNGGIFLLNSSVTDINSTTVNSTVGVVASGDIIIKNNNGGFTFTKIIKSNNGSITLESKFNMLDLTSPADDPSLFAENGTVSLSVSDSGAFIGASGNPIEIRARGLTTSISNPANRFIAFTNTTPAATEDTPPPQQQQQQQSAPATCTAALAAEGICTLTAQQKAPPVGGDGFTPENLPDAFGPAPTPELVNQINRNNTAGKQAGFVAAIENIVKDGC